MNPVFSNLANSAHNSFIHSTLAHSNKPNVISFAAGSPNFSTFPVHELNAACDAVLTREGVNALKYGPTEGEHQLREWIAARYREKQNLSISAENILIVNGSQQALDLIGRLFIDNGAEVAIEQPGYSGAIDAFSAYGAKFLPFNIDENGADISALQNIFENHSPRFVYSVCNFSNPMGITYPLENRRQIAKIMQGTNTIFVEDNPYDKLRWSGQPTPSMLELLPNQSIQLGTFSKIIAPGLRVGWVVSQPKIITKLATLRSSADLQPNTFSQRVILQYLHENNLDEHISKIKKLYSQKCTKMLEMLGKYMPETVQWTKPDGGMFIWLTLPNNVSGMKLFEAALAKNVLFIPADPFFIKGANINALRLNFTNSTEEDIQNGIKILSEEILHFA